MRAGARIGSPHAPLVSRPAPALRTVRTSTIQIIMRPRLTFAVLLFALSAPAAAAIDDDFCRNGIFGVQNPSVGLAVISGRGRAYFLEDMDGCPNAETRCRQNSYVIPGDTVVTGRSKGRYACVFFPNKGGGSAGWIESTRLRRIPIRQNPAIREWVGQWSDLGNPEVRFYVSLGRLMVEGDSYWPSPNPPLSERPGGPNVGNIGEAVRVTGNRAHAPDCNISFTLLGNLLVAADPDMECGGANVSFTGVYRRRRR